MYERPVAIYLAKVERVLHQVVFINLCLTVTFKCYKECYIFNAYKITMAFFDYERFWYICFGCRVMLFPLLTPSLKRSSSLWNWSPGAPPRSKSTTSVQILPSFKQAKDSLWIAWLFPNSYTMYIVIIYNLKSRNSIKVCSCIQDVLKIGLRFNLIKML